MANYKIIFDKENCIGDMSCIAVNDKFWAQDEEMKVNLIGAKFNEETKKFELIIDEKDFKLNKQIADDCPAGVIKIIKIGE